MNSIEDFDHRLFFDEFQFKTNKIDKLGNRHYKKDWETK